MLNRAPAEAEDDGGTFREFLESVCGYPVGAAKTAVGRIQRFRTLLGGGDLLEAISSRPSVCHMFANVIANVNHIMRL